MSVQNILCKFLTQYVELVRLDLVAHGVLFDGIRALLFELNCISLLFSAVCTVMPYATLTKIDGQIVRPVMIWCTSSPVQIFAHGTDRNWMNRTNLDTWLSSHQIWLCS